MRALVSVRDPGSTSLWIMSDGCIEDTVYYSGRGSASHHRALPTDPAAVTLIELECGFNCATLPQIPGFCSRYGSGEMRAVNVENVE